MLTLFHTTSSNEALFRALLSEMGPEVPARHVVAADLLDRAAAQGCVTADIAADTRDRMQAALDDGASMLLCTCSTLGTCADQMNDPRVSRIDRAMARKATAQGGRVLVAACVASTIEPTVILLREAGPAAHMETLLMADLWPYFRAGDNARYWQGIAERLRERASAFDCIVLAQASMAGAADLLRDLPVPVLSSPRIGLEAAIAEYRKLS
ncbi:MAG: aspartate/glutamate racemase family protein [Acidobacteriota bacterium]